MQRQSLAIPACVLLSLGLTACGTTAPGAPGKTMKTQQISSFATGGGGTVNTMVGTETCAVPTVVNETVPVAQNVIAHTPVTTAVPVTRMVPVTETVGVTSVVPSIATVQSAVSVPRVAMTTVQSPVQYTQYTSPWVAQSSCGASAYGAFGYGGCGIGGLGGYGAFGGLGYGGLGIGGLGGYGAFGAGYPYW